MVISAVKDDDEKGASMIPIFRGLVWFGMKGCVEKTGDEGG